MTIELPKRTNLEVGQSRNLLDVDTRGYFSDAERRIVSDLHNAGRLMGAVNQHAQSEFERTVSQIEELNKAKAQASGLALKAEADAIAADLNAIRGVNAESFDFEGEIRRRLGKVATDTFGSLSNDEQRNQYEAIVRQVEGSLLEKARLHKRNELHNATVDASKAAIANVSRSVSLASTDDELALNIGNMKAAIGRLAKLQGLDEESIELMESKEIGNALKLQLDKYVDGGNLQGAQDLMNKYAGYMRANDVLALKKAVNDEINRQTDVMVGQQIADSDGGTVTITIPSSGGTGQRGKGASTSNMQNQEIIVREATKAGVPANIALAIAHIETGGRFNADAANPNSSARGLYQFMAYTRGKYGLDAKSVMDPTANARAGVKMIGENVQAFVKKMGRQPSAGEVYLMHQQGQAGGLALLSSDEPVAKVLGRFHKASTVNQIIKYNGGNHGMTAKQFAQKWIQKADDIAEEYGGGRGEMSVSLPTSSREEFMKVGVEAGVPVKRLEGLWAQADKVKNEREAARKEQLAQTKVAIQTAILNRGGIENLSIRERAMLNTLPAPEQEEMASYSLARKKGMDAQLEYQNMGTITGLMADKEKLAGMSDAQIIALAPKIGNSAANDLVRAKANYVERKKQDLSEEKGLSSIEKYAAQQYYNEKWGGALSTEQVAYFEHHVKNAMNEASLKLGRNLTPDERLKFIHRQIGVSTQQSTWFGLGSDKQVFAGAEAPYKSFAKVFDDN